MAPVLRLNTVDKKIFVKFGCKVGKSVILCL